MRDTVIFDLDGTLLNTLEDLCSSTNYALESNGYPARTIEEVRRFVGNGIRKLMERALPEGIAADRTVFDRIFADFKSHYQIHCNDRTAPYDGILPLLRELKQRRYKTGVVSNKNRPAVEKLNEIYFEGLIDVSAGVSEGVPAKPDPYMVREVLERLESRRENTVYVGDSQVDIQTAANTGLELVTVLWGFRDREELKKAGAVRFIEKPMELLKFL